MVGLVVAVGLSMVVAARAATTTVQPGVSALADIVAVWQSDTTSGTSALSSCAWTGQRGAVLCDQTITTPAGVRHALSLFSFDSAAGKFVFYVLGQPGDIMRPVALTIDRHIWIYGGQTKDGNGTFSRTVNDFTAKDTYTWRLEASPDGEHWTSGIHGTSRRVR